MRKMTEQNLRDAFTAESCAHTRYLIFADQAESEGKPNVARLFRAIAYAERIHAGNHLKALGGSRSTSENLKSAIEGENFEIEEMYPAFDAVAKLQGEINSVQSINYAIEAEKPHSLLFGDAAAVLKNDQNADIDISEILICANCGFTMQSGSQRLCPICANDVVNFKKF